VLKSEIERERSFKIAYCRIVFYDFDCLQYIGEETEELRGFIV
jgi:hypothetical protein